MADLDSLLAEEELELFKKAENCTTVEELQKFEKETNTINEGMSQTSHIITVDTRFSMLMVNQSQTNGLIRDHIFSINLLGNIVL